MPAATLVALLAAALLLLRLAIELWLSQLNRRHVLAHAGSVPDASKEIIEPATYAKSVEYTLAKNRFGQFEDTWSALVLLVVLFSGGLPWAFDRFARVAGESVWSMAAFFLAVMFAMWFSNLPFDWRA